MNTRNIDKNVRTEWVIVPYTDYMKLLVMLENLDDMRTYDEAIELTDELLFANLVRRIKRVSVD